MDSSLCVDSAVERKTFHAFIEFSGHWDGFQPFGSKRRGTGKMVSLKSYICPKFLKLSLHFTETHLYIYIYIYIYR